MNMDFTHFRSEKIEFMFSNGELWPTHFWNKGDHKHPRGHIVRHNSSEVTGRARNLARVILRSVWEQKHHWPEEGTEEGQRKMDLPGPSASKEQKGEP